MSRALLRVGPKLALPAHEAQTETLVVYGGKGKGKTNFGAVLAEELARNRLRFSLLDPVGVSWGLKHSADGRGPGIELLILGGIHGDLPIEPTAGEVVADLVVDEDVSVLIDISRRADGRMWTQGEKIRFVRDYCLRLYQRQGERRRPLMQIIDEAGRFVPQQMPKGAIDIAECVGAIEQLVEWGRNVGVGVALITQRSARMNKSVSELAQALVAFQTTGPLSIGAIVDWFGEHVEKSRQRELIERIRELPVGTAMVVSPAWLKLEGEFEIRMRETFDSSATPRAGQERRAPGKGAQVDVARYRERIAETVERAEANDPRKLQSRIRELERQLKQFEERPTTPKRIEVPVEVPVSVLTDEDRYLLGKLQALGSPSFEEWCSNLAALQDVVERAAAVAVVQSVAAVQSVSRAQRESASRRAPSRATHGRAGGLGPESARQPEPDRDVKLGKGERTVLDALAEYPEGRTYNELAFLAGYSAKASTLGVILSNLRKAGLVEPGNQPVRATADGLAAAGGARERPTGRALLDGWLRHRRMGKGERSVLLALIAAFPNALSHDELCERTGYSPSASTLGVSLSKLRKLGLVEKGARKVKPEFMDSIKDE